MLRRLGRALIVTVSLALGGTSVGLAHSLPDSVLTLWYANEQLNLSITLPLEDLMIAEPALLGLSTASVGTDLTRQDLDRVEDYFLDHLTLQAQPEVVSLTLQSGKLALGHNDHVGEHVLLILEWRARFDLKENSLRLIYDAVMHEVRNHRAVVFWAPKDSRPVPLAEFGFRKQDGTVVPVVLQLPNVGMR